jgi:predicted nuclease of predicted toxin-antitoxin system
VRLLIDTQLPQAMAPWLRQRGFEAEHVLDIGLAQSKDNILWRYAQEQQAAVITKDEDFAEWVRRGHSGPPIVWLRAGNSSTEFLLQWLDALLPLIVRKLEQGERLIDVR